jgi:hypothetical protein
VIRFRSSFSLPRLKDLRVKEGTSLLYEVVANFVTGEDDEEQQVGLVRFLLGEGADSNLETGSDGWVAGKR